ncbi:hypothetical protein [Streptomyces sp. NPDC001100]
MAGRGGNNGEAGDIRRSPLADYAELSGSPPPSTETAAPDPPSSDVAARVRHEFAVLLGEFRRTAVLVPTDEDDAPLAGDFGGIRWIYAFSNEAAPARFAIARGEGDREWPYLRLLGARGQVIRKNAAGQVTTYAYDMTESRTTWRREAEILHPEPCHMTEITVKRPAPWTT